MATSNYGMNENPRSIPLGGEENDLVRARISSLFTALFFVAVLGLEVGVLLVGARRKHFWYDELLTFYISSLHPFSLLRRALQAGADGMTSSYYGMVQLARMLPGDPHVTLRLPSILGYVLTLLAVFWFARKRLPVLTSLVAVLLISVSQFRLYALEARSYTLLVGFFAIAAALWQRVGERRFMAPLLGVFLALAVSCHQLAVIALSAFGVAELTWSFLSRRIRWGVWAAFLFATFPFLLSLRQLLAYRSDFGKTFWARPRWWMLAETYQSYVGLDFNLSVALVALLGILIAWQLRTLRKCEQREPNHDPGLPEIILLGGFLGYPALLVVLAKFLHGGYVDRYGWPAVLGLILGSVYLLRPSWAASAYLVAALLIAFVGRDVRDFEYLYPADLIMVEERWTRLEGLFRDEPRIPAVIGDPFNYLEASLYSPRGLQDRLVYVVGSDTATRLVGSDTPDRTNRLLAQFCPLQVEDLAPFEAGHKRFILYSGGQFDWFTQYLLEKGHHLRLVSKLGNRSVYIVE
jgi:hypothetical protein